MRLRESYSPIGRFGAPVRSDWSTFLDWWRHCDRGWQVAARSVVRFRVIYWFVWVATLHDGPTWRDNRRVSLFVFAASALATLSLDPVHVPWSNTHRVVRLIDDEICARKPITPDRLRWVSVLLFFRLFLCPAVRPYRTRATDISALLLFHR